jgi:hypothetical protein
MLHFQLCLKILGLGGSKWLWQLAYYNTATNTAVKSLIVQAPGAFALKLLTTVINSCGVCHYVPSTLIFASKTRLPVI